MKEKKLFKKDLQWHFGMNNTTLRIAGNKLYCKAIEGKRKYDEAPMLRAE